jgi:cell division protein FtsQ
VASEFIYVDDRAGRGKSRRRKAGRFLYAEERSGKSPVKADKWFVRLIILVAGILAAELLWLFGITPLLPLSAVEADEVPGIDRASLLARAGISARSSYFTVNAARAEKNLERLHQIESVRVVKQYPDTVRIFIERRRPAALSLVNTGGRITPVYIDKHGLLFQIGGSLSRGVSPPLPIVSGLAFDRLEEGAKLPAELEGFFGRLDSINENAPELLAFISEIGINRKAHNGFDLIVYPVNGGIRFRMEADLNEDALRYMILMTDVFDSAGVPADEVDLRNGTASYIVKEARSG